MKLGQYVWRPYRPSNELDIRVADVRNIVNNEVNCNPGSDYFDQDSLSWAFGWAKLSEEEPWRITAEQNSSGETKVFRWNAATAVGMTSGWDEVPIPIKPFASPYEVREILRPFIILRVFNTTRKDKYV